MLIYDDVGGVIPLPDNVYVAGDQLVIDCKGKMTIKISLQTIKQAIRTVNNDSERVSQTDILDRPAN
jgi:hypothetical protein